MSTHSTITIERKDGSKTSIYCHFDGYIEYNGSILYKHYDTAEKVEKLIALGDLQCLGKSVRADDESGCRAYHRDRGEDFCQSGGCEEYNYVFDEALGEWYVEYDDYANDEVVFEPLSKAIKKVILNER